MSAHGIRFVLLALLVAVSGFQLAGPASAQPPAAPLTELTPPRVSYAQGDVSFWRPGGQDWAPARVNTPLAPGDVLYAGSGATLEIQVGPTSFVRAAEGTQLGLDNQEPGFLQLRVIAGHAALDLRDSTPESVIELDAPGATFTVERPGYYGLHVDEQTTTLAVHHGGPATMTTVGRTGMPVTAGQRVVVTGAGSPRVAIEAAPGLTAWDRWGLERTEQLMQAARTRYVSPAVYGTEALDRYGTWRTVETYGPVWVPTAAPVGWVPYSTGRWIWDPRFGWTWLDDEPWGWAPYHYGRWVLIGSYWAWAPGPVVVRAVYAPALVVFLGSVDVSVHRPVYWAPLSWGEPLIPWWGRPGFVGRPYWAGWGGPRVVNNVVVNRSTIVNVTNITVYRNVHVTSAIVGVPADRFGRGRVEVTRLQPAEARQLQPVRGPLAIRPVAASAQPAAEPALKPPAASQTRPVMATRPPRDPRPALREQGLTVTPEAPRSAAPRLVPGPKPSARTRDDAPVVTPNARGRNVAAPPLRPPATPQTGSPPPGLEPAGRGQGQGQPVRAPGPEIHKGNGPPPGFGPGERKLDQGPGARVVPPESDRGPRSRRPAPSVPSDG